MIEAKVADLVAGAKEEMTRIAEQGGAVAAVENGYMKSALVASHALRRQRIKAGEDIVVGVNKFETTEPNPLTEDLDTAIQTVIPASRPRPPPRSAPGASAGMPTPRSAIGPLPRSPGSRPMPAPMPT